MGTKNSSFTEKQVAWNILFTSYHTKLDHISKLKISFTSNGWKRILRFLQCTIIFTRIISMSSPKLHGWNIADTINLCLHIDNTKGVHNMN